MDSLKAPRRWFGLRTLGVVVVTAVPQACIEDGPSRAGHDHQQHDAREQEPSLALLLALPPGFLGGALGKAGGFLW